MKQVLLKHGIRPKGNPPQLSAVPGSVFSGYLVCTFASQPGAERESNERAGGWKDLE